MGEAFFGCAGKKQDPQAILDVWVRYKDKRLEMAAIVCWLLESLDMTGKREDGFVAAFFNNHSEHSVTFETSRND